jgi:hypothetical protein
MSDKQYKYTMRIELLNGDCSEWRDNNKRVLLRFAKKQGCLWFAVVKDNTGAVVYRINSDGIVSC